MGEETKLKLKITVLYSWKINQFNLETIIRFFFQHEFFRQKSVKLNLFFEIDLKTFSKIAQYSERDQNVQKVKRKSDLQFQKYFSKTYLGSLPITW